ncbi:MAG: UPF0182 family protein [Armatimonadota bacterium]|nr:UPF0182 family protein [Armatimonadota bacterium]MDW8025016.1 UPF0182 family protein [Armatimonadota bacterium]
MSGWRLVGFIAIAVGGVIIIMKLLSVYAEWLWFVSEGYQHVYGKILLTRLLLFAVASPIFFSMLYIPWRYIRRLPVPPSSRKWLLDADELRAVERAIDNTVLLVSLAAALIAGYYASHKWLTVLQSMHPTPMELEEPIFNKPVDFYLFKLPLWLFVLGLVSTGLSLSIIGAILLLIFDDHISFTEMGTEMTDYAVRILSLMAALWFIAASIGTRFGMFKLLYSMRGRVYGVGFADYYAALPALWVLIFVFVVVALILLLNFKRGSIRILLWSTGTAIALSFVGRFVVPGLVQAFVVNPNELQLEKPFIEHNIRFTRYAYNLDRFRELPYFVRGLSREAAIENAATLSSIRLWDTRPLKSTYEQLQSIRPYYSFIDVDVDRYFINGKLRQVAIAARELVQHLQARTWVNDHLKYTHGYGVVMSFVNEATNDGSPVFIIKDIPPTPQVKGLMVRQPRIYFGELQLPQPSLPPPPQKTPAAPQPPEEGMPTASGEQSQDSTPPAEVKPSPQTYRRKMRPQRERMPIPEYVIVRGSESEFDYPAADGPRFCRYEGDGGVPINSFFKRLAFAARFTDLMLFLTSAVTKESKLLMYRKIHERIQAIAPFLLLDPDPYIVLGDDGHLYWLVDAYTVSPFFPYATPDVLDPRRVHYIRNSVKVTVDAYNGKVNFYVIEDADRADPLIRTYQKIFPSMFKPISKMPEHLRRHIRYPKRLFMTQAIMLTHYHMTDPVQFYNMEDVWEIPKELYAGSQRLMEPYYVVMRLPGENKEGFMLILPFTPREKQNMIAWMAAHCDPEDYGKVVIFRFPRGTFIPGPMQIEARIDQDPTISQYLTLWNQRGSQVIRGHLLVIPISFSLLYVEPLFLQSEQTQLPQLKKVLVASEDKVAMADTIYEAIGRVVDVDSKSLVGSLDSNVSKTEVPSHDSLSSRLSEQISERMKKFEDAQRKGDWKAMEREWKALKELVEELQSSSGNR